MSLLVKIVDVVVIYYVDVVVVVVYYVDVEFHIISFTFLFMFLFDSFLEPPTRYKLQYFCSFDFVNLNIY